MTRPAMMAAGLVLLGCATPTAPPPEEENPPPPAPFLLEIQQGDAHEVEHGEVLPVNLLIHREDGFEEPINFSAEATPGILVFFRPALVLHRDDTELLIVAEQHVPAATHEIRLIGKVTGKADRSVVLELTVKE